MSNRLMHLVFSSGCRVLVAAGLFTAPAAIAQEVEEATQQESETVEAPQVFSPTRTPILYRDAASSVTVIDQQQLESTRSPFIIDALQGTPGLDIRTDGPAGQRPSLFMRGTDSDHVKVLLDGIDISDVASPVGAPYMDHLLVGGTGQIEVLRGPQSALFGSDAIGGAINITTRSPITNAPRFTYFGEGGSFHTARNQVTAQAAGRGYAGYLSYTNFHTDGISIADGSENDPYRNNSLSTKLRLEPTDTFALEGVFHYFHAETEFDFFGADGSNNQTQSEQFLAKLQPEFTFWDGRWVSKLNLNLNHTKRITDDGFLVGFPLTRSQFIGHAYEADWQNDIQLAHWNLLTVGASVREEQADTPGFEADRDITSIYLQDQIVLGDGRVHINPGIRHDSFSDFGSHTTWRLAGSYQHRETATTFRGSFGTGFNAPALAELYTPGFSNPNLDAEESTGWDAGIEQVLVANRAMVGVTYFQNRIDELIQFDFATFSPQNIGDARTQGIEVYGEFRPCDGLILRPSYTYTDTENLDTGMRLLRRPMHKASLQAIATFMEEKATVGLGIHYIGEREDFGSTGVVTNDDYWLVRLTGSLQVRENVKLIGRVENLLNEDYQDVLGFNNPGIGIYGGVELTF